MKLTVDVAQLNDRAFGLISSVAGDKIDKSAKAIKVMASENDGYFLMQADGPVGTVLMELKGEYEGDPMQVEFNKIFKVCSTLKGTLTVTAELDKERAQVKIGQARFRTPIKIEGIEFVDFSQINYSLKDLDGMSLKKALHAAVTTAASNNYANLALRAVNLKTTAAGLVAQASNGSESTRATLAKSHIDDHFDLCLPQDSIGIINSFCVQGNVSARVAMHPLSNSLLIAFSGLELPPAYLSIKLMTGKFPDIWAKLPEVPIKTSVLMSDVIPALKRAGQFDDQDGYVLFTFDGSQVTLSSRDLQGNDYSEEIVCSGTVAPFKFKIRSKNIVTCFGEFLAIANGSETVVDVHQYEDHLLILKPQEPKFSVEYVTAVIREA